MTKQTPIPGFEAACNSLEATEAARQSAKQFESVTATQGAFISGLGRNGDLEGQETLFDVDGLDG